jgi:hypothetical protein
MDAGFYADLVGMVIGASLLGVLVRAVRVYLVSRLSPFADQGKR